MLSKAQKWEYATIGALLLGNLEWCSFLRAFLFRRILMRFSRDALQMGISLHRGPVGETGGGSFTKNFGKKEKAYLSSFLGPRGH
jgi:hypothetical protein